MKNHIDGQVLKPCDVLLPAHERRVTPAAGSVCSAIRAQLHRARRSIDKEDMR